uniref:PDZ domain-containing protein n=1 Tax=Ditylenchus dipsaci TaxID=166011 RepID=A0A915E8S5_9BILA
MSENPLLQMDTTRIQCQITKGSVAQQAGLRLGDYIEELQNEYRPDIHTIDQLVNNSSSNTLAIVLLRDFVNGESFITTSDSCVQQTRNSSRSDRNTHQQLHSHHKSGHKNFPSYAFRLKTNSNNNNNQKKQDNCAAVQLPNNLSVISPSTVLQSDVISLKPPPSYMQSETLRMIREGEIQKRWSNNNNNCKENFNNSFNNKADLNGGHNKQQMLPECFVCGRNIV